MIFLVNPKLPKYIDSFKNDKLNLFKNKVIPIILNGKPSDNFDSVNLTALEQEAFLKRIEECEFCMLYFKSLTGFTLPAINIKILNNKACITDLFDLPDQKNIQYSLKVFSLAFYDMVYLLFSEKPDLKLLEVPFKIDKFDFRNKLNIKENETGFNILSCS